MRQDDMLNLQRALRGKRDILVCVSLWVNNGRCSRGLVPDQVGCVRQARQVELFKDQAAPSSLTDSYFG
jgi:hypothetical protein